MTTVIPIERLKAATVIHRVGDDFGPTGDFAEVQGIEFDGESYIVTARFLEGADDHVGDTEVRFAVDAGGSIDFGGRGEPSLRIDAEISFDEWKAKADAIGADIDRTIGKINAAQGYVCREIDERPLVAAVAGALGVPSLELAS